MQTFNIFFPPSRIFENSPPIGDSSIQFDYIGRVCTLSERGQRSTDRLLAPPPARVGEFFVCLYVFNFSVFISTHVSLIEIYRPEKFPGILFMNSNRRIKEMKTGNKRNRRKNYLEWEYELYFISDSDMLSVNILGKYYYNCALQ